MVVLSLELKMHLGLNLVHIAKQKNRNYNYMQQVQRQIAQQFQRPQNKKKKRNRSQDESSSMTSEDGLKSENLSQTYNPVKNPFMQAQTSRNKGKPNKSEKVKKAEDVINQRKQEHYDKLNQNIVENEYDKLQRERGRVRRGLAHMPTTPKDNVEEQVHEMTQRAAQEVENKRKLDRDANRIQNNNQI